MLGNLIIAQTMLMGTVFHSMNTPTKEDSNDSEEECEVVIISVSCHKDYNDWWRGPNGHRWTRTSSLRRETEVSVIN